MATCPYCGKSFNPRAHFLRGGHEATICGSPECRRARNADHMRRCRERKRAQEVHAIRRSADTKAQKLERDLLQVRRDMELPAAERYQAQKSWTKDQRNYARRIYESRNGLFRGAGKMWE